MENNPAKSVASFVSAEIYTFYWSGIVRTGVQRISLFPLSATDRSLLSMETSSTTNVGQFNYLYDI